MSLGFILLIIFVVVLIGGVGPWSPRGYGFGFGHKGVGVVAVILIIIVILLLTGRL